MLHSIQFLKTAILNVKHSSEPVRRTSILPYSVLSAAALASLLAACGQQGPLYMPVRPAPLATTPAKPSSTPATPPAAPAPVLPSATPANP